MILRLRHACWMIILISIAGSSQAGQRQTIRNLDFATFRIDLLPFEFRIPRYEFTHCERDRLSDIDVIEARIDKPNGETWAHVYQMLPPEEGSFVSCAATRLNVREYCYRSQSPVQSSQACGALSIHELDVRAYRAKPDQAAPPEHLYATIDGTLVVFAFADEISWEATEQVLEAMESMTRVTPRELLNYRPRGAANGELWALLREASAKEHVDQIPFSKLIPRPLPTGFDRIQGYAYWDMYGLEFQRNRSGEHSQLRIGFSETKRLPRLKTCWSEHACDLVATTSRGRKIFTPKKRRGSSRPGSKAREYYVDIEGTLVILSWPHWRRSEGKNVFRSHEFAPRELERLIDLLGRATSNDLVRFPNMSIMGTGGGKMRGPFASRVMQASTSSIQIVEPSAQTACVKILDDGSTAIVGKRNLQIGQNNSLRPCEP
jgi:hypothetical protein